MHLLLKVWNSNLANGDNDEDDSGGDVLNKCGGDLGEEKAERKGIGKKEFQGLSFWIEFYREDIIRGEKGESLHKTPFFHKIHLKGLARRMDFVNPHP